MIYRLEGLDIERRASIYSKCIFIAVNKGYKKNVVYRLDGVDFRYDDIVSVCHYVIDSYGNENEKKKYDILYGNKDIELNKEYKNKIYYERLKSIYEIKKEYNANNMMLKKKAKLFKFNISDLNKLCYEYIVDYLKYSKMEYDWFLYSYCQKKSNVRVKMSFAMLLELLCKFDDEKDIVYIIDYSGYKIINESYSKVDSYIKNYCQDKTDEEKEIIKNDLYSKINLYKKVKGISKVNNNMDKEKFIEDFIDSDFDYITEYCKSLGVNYSLFTVCLNYVRKNNKRLYNLYLVKVSKSYFKNNENSDMYIYKMIIYWVLHGYNDRKIDLLDLISISGFSFKKLDKLAIFSLNREEYCIIDNFIKKNNMKLNKLLLKGISKADIIKCLNDNSIKSYLADIVMERLNNGIGLDDLIVNDINYVNKCREERNSYVK